MLFIHFWVFFVVSFYFFSFSQQQLENLNILNDFDDSVSSAEILFTSRFQI